MRMYLLNAITGMTLAILPNLAPCPALAAPANATIFAETVPHADLDLTTREGIDRLDSRVATRIRQLCANGGRDGASLRLARRCREAALTRAERQVRLAVAEANAARARFAEKEPASAADTPGA